MKTNKKPAGERFGDFLTGRGFYIALFLCVIAIGISGYYLLRSNSLPSFEEEAYAPVAGTVEIHLDEDTQPKDAAPKGEPGPAASAPTPVREPEPEPQPEPKPLPAVTPEPPAIKASFIWPVAGEVTTVFSDETPVWSGTLADWRTHAGVDLAAPIGTEVMAVSAGRVSSVYEDDMMGVTVVIAHSDGISSVYSNLAGTPVVSEGDSVQTGDVIGAVGATALAEIDDAPHLHLEILQNGFAVDPAKILPAR